MFDIGLLRHSMHVHMKTQHQVTEGTPVQYRKYPICGHLHPRDLHIAPTTPIIHYHLRKLTLCVILHNPPEW